MQDHTVHGVLYTYSPVYCSESDCVFHAADSNALPSSSSDFLLHTNIEVAARPCLDAL